MSKEEADLDREAGELSKELFEDLNGYPTRLIEGSIKPDEIPTITGMWVVGIHESGNPFYTTFPLDGTDRTNELEDAIRRLPEMLLPSEEGRKAITDLGIRTIAGIGVGHNSQGEELVALCCHPDLTQHGCISFLKLSLNIRQQLLTQN